MVMSAPPHPLMHFGMAGWFKIKDEETAYYKLKKPEEQTDWPPKYTKFLLQTAEDDTEAAFVDFRRFARIRLIDCDAAGIRNESPLKENGPDPVQDADTVSEEWLAAKLKSKHIPVKALLLDQANISGIGNWVGDEILYDAKIHPEQYSDTLRSEQVAQLHKSIHYVCKLSVDNLADSRQFPEEWLFKHRWGKGKKDSATTLPNGQRFVFVTVGGRTSCVVPSVQKKTGPVAGDVKTTKQEEAGEDEGADKKCKRGGKKAAVKEEEVADEEKAEVKSKKQPPKKGTKRAAGKTEPEEQLSDDDTLKQSSKASEPASKKKKLSGTTETKSKPKEAARNGAKAKPEADTGPRRRSARTSGAGR